jgi:hypothetical protein
MALEMIDELAGWGLRPPLLTADAGYGQVAEFRQGLSDRGIPYLVAITSSTTVQPGDAEPVEVTYAGVGQYPAPRYPHPARSIKDLALEVGADHATLVHWRERLPTQEGAGDRPAATLSGHFFAVRVRPAGRTARRGTPQHGDGVLPDCWLLVQWPPGHDEPSDYWLSDLAADTPLTDLVHDREAIKSGSAGGRAEKDQPQRLAPRCAAHPSAWITSCRRTVRDYERLPEHHAAIVQWSMIIIMTRRLARHHRP